MNTRTEYARLNDGDPIYPKGMPTVCGIDIGYSGVKVMSDEMAAVFPAYAVRMAGAYLGGLQDGTIIYEDEEGAWIVGEDAIAQIRSGDTNVSDAMLYGRTRYLAPMYRVLALTGLGIALWCGDQDNCIVQTGLPAVYLSEDKDYLKDIFTGYHRFSLTTSMGHKDFECYVKSTDVISQPMGTLFSVMTDAAGKFTADAGQYMDGNILILDAGFGTLDLVPIRRHVIDSARIQTFDDLGMKGVLQTAAAALKEDLGVQCTVAGLQKALICNGGEIRYAIPKACPARRGPGADWVKRADISGYLADAAEDVCMRALGRIEDIYDMADMDKLIITGGTAAAWEPYIRDWSPAQVVRGDVNTELGMIYANVRGYYMYRLMSEEQA